MINRRFLDRASSGGHAETIRQADHNFLRLQLEVANMRVVRTQRMSPFE